MIKLRHCSVIAKSYINERSSTTPKNVQKLHNYLDKHIAPHIGDYPIASITAQDVIKTGLAIQTYFEKRGKWTTDTSHKCIALISSVIEVPADIAYMRAKESWFCAVCEHAMWRGDSVSK